VLISEQQIAQRVQELATEISAYYADLLNGEPLIIVPVLTGSYIFAADLSRKLTIPNVIDFIALSSYRGSTRSTGEVQIILDTRDSVWGKHVLIIEDIVDSGYTLKFLGKLFDVSS
jgi:hypoxanthine phosphoribosyltransferase